VVTGVAIVAAYADREQFALKIKSVYAPAPPKAANGAVRGAVPDAVTGDAPWALSALPECFRQRSKATSVHESFILAHLPKHAVMVRPPATLQFADCTLRVAGAEIFVRRGKDELRIAPPARLYTAQDAVALLRATPTGYELRTYGTSGF